VATNRFANAGATTCWATDVTKTLIGLRPQGLETEPSKAIWVDDATTTPRMGRTRLVFGASNCVEPK